MELFGYDCGVRKMEKLICLSTRSFSALEGLLDGTTSAATMETTLGDMLPTLLAGASGHRLASSGREDSYQQHTSSLTDMDEEFSSALAGKGIYTRKRVIILVIFFMFVRLIAKLTSLILNHPRIQNLLLITRVIFLPVCITLQHQYPLPPQRNFFK